MGNFNAMHVTFGLYLIVVLLIGIAAYFSTRDFGDYILGGRSLGPFVTAMSAGASDMSGWLLMGLPGAVFLSGLSQSWIARAYGIQQQCPDFAGLFLPTLRFFGHGD